MAELAVGVQGLTGGGASRPEPSGDRAGLGPWVLASASPRRADLLAAAGYVFEVLPADVDETPRAGESAADAALRLAEDKARAVAALRPGALVLAGDTVVVRSGALLGKPADADEARAMLASLSGRRHEVISSAALHHAPSGTMVSGRHVSVVEFAALDTPTLEAYVAGGEWRGKAGAYAIQGDAAAFASLRSGRLDTVIGLSLALVEELLEALRARRAAAPGGTPEETP